MSRDLAGEVEKLLKSSNSYLRKKVSSLLYVTQHSPPQKPFVSLRLFFSLFQFLNYMTETCTLRWHFVKEVLSLASESSAGLDTIFNVFSPFRLPFVL